LLLVQEADAWSVEDLKAAKAAAVEKAVAALVGKLKALHAKPRRRTLLERIKARLFSHVNLALSVKGER